MKFRDEFTLAGKHLGHTQASFQNAERRLDQFAQRLETADTPPKKVPLAAEVAKLG